MPSQLNTAKSEDVFINCPFDESYWPLMKAILFSVSACGFNPRCARESDDGGEVRLEKIIRIIRECRLGIHDLSRKGVDPSHGLARFNMPFELGLFLGAARFGQLKKHLLIMETDRFDYQKFISDIAGQDIRAHGDEEVKVIGHVRDWLNAQKPKCTLPGATALRKLYAEFKKETPLLLRASKLKEADATFIDWSNLIVEWLRSNQSRHQP